MRKYLVLTLTVFIAACSSGKFAGDSTQVEGSKDAATKANSKISNSTTEGSRGGPGLDGETTIDGITNMPDSNTVVFGGKGVYRVGDGEATQTSCKETVIPFQLEGDAYSFIFSVEQDNTKVSFQLGRLCGIDSDSSNFLSVVNLDSSEKLDESILGKVVVEEGQPLLAPLKSELVLNQGKYAVRIYSDFRDGPGSDRDDFVVGNIQLKADKPIIGKEIKTN